MTEEQFQEVVSNRITLINNVLAIKGKEYRRGDNAMHNFNRAAEISGTTREKALWGFATKHLVSFLDILDDIEKGNLPTEDVVNEKVGDLVNYLILAEASIKDKINNKQNG
jgi:hypothetical protein